MEQARRYQIFISSTFEDLKRHRKALIDQILKLGHIPAGMELFSAGDENEFEVIKRAIDQSDLYVVLIGATYGSVKPGTNPAQSYTQLEFEYARDTARKPCMAFLLNNQEFRAERNEIEQNKKKDCDYAVEVRAFRSDVSRGRIVQFFSKDNPYQLVANFQTALLNISTRISDRLMGYVRAKELLDIQQQVSLLGMVGQTDIMRDIVMQLNQYDKLARRVNEQSTLKRDLAIYFWRRFAAPIFRSGYRDLFFESGSTLAYLSSELLNFMKNNEAMLVTTANADQRLRVRTNNILTYLSYVLLSQVKTSLVPHGPPDTKYGATYGEFAIHFSDEIAPSPSSVRTKDILPEERKVIDRVRIEALIGGDSSPKKQLFFAAASGLELVNEDPLFQGPHVGNYRNMLLKRAIYETGCPVILFLDETKIDRNFEPNRCYSVMTKGMPWSKIYSDNPIAVCFAAASIEAFSTIAERLLAIKFLPAYDRHEEFQRQSSGKTYCGLFANGNFYALFDELEPTSAMDINPQVYACTQSQVDSNKAKSADSKTPAVD
jgi:hypothetical protein